MNRLARIVALACCAALTACDAPPIEDCGPNASPTGKTEKHPHPRKPLSCGPGVQLANFCVYDGNGRLKAVEQEVSGVCLKFGTP